MKKKSDTFSPEDAQHFAKTGAGQQLLIIIRQADSDQLRQAAALAAQGKTEQAELLLSDLLKNPQVKELLSQLGR
jgi:hypothetical protein